MTFNQLINVLEVSRIGSITKAARILSLPQSYLSNSIRSLEGELGIPLFFRNKAGVVLTPEGEEFIRYASEVVENYQALMRLGEARKVKRFSIGAPPMSFCAEAFASLVDRHANDVSLHFSLRGDSNDRAVSALQSGELDLAIMLTTSSLKYPIYEMCEQKKIKLDPIGTLPINVHIRRGHPLLEQHDPQGGNFPFRALADYPYVDYLSGVHGLNLRAAVLQDVYDLFPENSRQVILVTEYTQKDCIVLGTDAYALGIARLESQQHPDLVEIPVPNGFFKLYFATSLLLPVADLTQEFRTLLLEALSQSPAFTPGEARGAKGREAY